MATLDRNQFDRAYTSVMLRTDHTCFQWSLRGDCCANAITMAIRFNKASLDDDFFRFSFLVRAEACLIAGANLVGKQRAVVGSSNALAGVM